MDTTHWATHISEKGNLTEVIMMNERYEHEGVPLNEPIIRDILTNKQPPPQEFLSIKDLEERVTRYHLRHGGNEPIILNRYAAVRSVLEELREAGRVEKIVDSSRRVSFRSTNDNRDPIDRLVDVIRQERERIETDIASLENRKIQLDTILSEYDR